MTNVRTALRKHPGLRLARTRVSFVSKLMAFWQGRSFRSKGFFPPTFRKTMGKSDERLPPHTHGLGVMIGKEARFYPMNGIGSGTDDTWGERTLKVRIGEEDRIPFATWSDDGQRPMQIFSRWQGFSYTFPGCGIAT